MMSYFLPQFKFNLLSINALTLGSQLTLSFFRDQFFIQEATTKRMIGKADKVQDLYVLDMRVLNYITSAFVGNVFAHIWHNRLGNLSSKKIRCVERTYGV